LDVVRDKAVLNVRTESAARSPEALRVFTVISKSLPQIFLVALLAVALYLFAPADLGRIDFAEYWAAMQIAWSGGNPYDPNTLWALQEPFLRGQVDSAVRMWNPPLIVPFIFWLGRCPFEPARVVWLSASMVALAAIIVQWRGLFAPAGPQQRRFLLFVATWYPAALCISYGQSSWIFALLVSTFLWRAWHSENEPRRDWWFGLMLGGAMMKPHLFSLWIVVLVVDFIRRGCWRAPVAWIGGVLMGSLIAEILFPGIWRHYLDATRSPPLTFMTPTLGSLTQAPFPSAPVISRFGPLVLGATVCAVWRWRGAGTPPSDAQAGQRDVMARAVLLPASFLISPYGWVYDQVALLPTVALLLAHRSNEWAVWIVALANVPLLLTPPSWGQQVAVWYPAAIFLAGLAVIRNDFPKRFNPVPASYSVDTEGR
jgi:hypothetical protein